MGFVWQEFLASLSQPLWVFTNTGEASAERALELLGVAHYFKGVLGADFMGDVCKPQHQAFRKVTAGLHQLSRKTHRNLTENFQGHSEEVHSQTLFTKVVRVQGRNLNA